MQRWKSLVLIVFSTFLFVGTIGMGVFRHSCHDDGSTTSFFFEQADACGHEEEVEPCCSLEEDHNDEQEDDCCDDEVSVYQVKLDFSQDHLVIPLIKIPSPVNYFGVYTSALHLEKVFAKPITRPPPRKGRTILVENQTFLI